MNWKQFIVLYEESEALVRLQEVLKMSSQNRGLKITLRQLIPGPGKSNFKFNQTYPNPTKPNLAYPNLV